MKKHIISILAAVAALMLACTSCLYEEKSDVTIDYDFEYGDYSGSTSASATETMKTAKDACYLAFYTSGLEMMGSSTLVLRDQTSNKEARKQAKALSSSIDGYLSGFAPAMDVTIKINISSLFGDETAATKTYKAKL